MIRFSRPSSWTRRTIFEASEVTLTFMVKRIVASAFRGEHGVSKRWVVYSVAVVAGIAADASAVFLVGSAQRRDDRAALTAYEEQLLRAVREAGRIAEQEMKPSLAEIAGNEVTAEQIAERAIGWRRALEQTRTDVLRLDPPSFLGDIGRRWADVIDAYLRTVDALTAAVRASGPERARLLVDASSAGSARTTSSNERLS